MRTTISLLSVFVFFLVGVAPLASAYFIEDVSPGYGYFDYNRQISTQDEWPLWIGRRNTTRSRLSPFTPPSAVEAPAAQLSEDWPDWIGRVR